jgi:hypothetical protein
VAEGRGGPKRQGSSTLFWRGTLSLVNPDNPLKKSADTYTLSADSILKNGGLVVKEPGYSLAYKISFLPKKGDLIGPFKLSNADLPEFVKNGIESNGSGGKVFLDEVEIKSATGTISKATYLILLK